LAIITALLRIAEIEHSRRLEGLAVPFAPCSASRRSLRPDRRGQGLTLRSKATRRRQRPRSSFRPSLIW
jgi:hypothetical protein